MEGPYACLCSEPVHVWSIGRPADCSGCDSPDACGGEGFGISRGSLFSASECVCDCTRLWGGRSCNISETKDLPLPPEGCILVTFGFTIFVGGVVLYLLRQGIFAPVDEKKANQLLFTECADWALDWILFGLAFYEGDLWFHNDPDNVVRTFILVLCALSAAGWALELALFKAPHSRTWFCQNARRFSFAHVLFEDGAQVVLYSIVAAGNASAGAEVKVVHVVLVFAAAGQSLLFFVTKGKELFDAVQQEIKACKIDVETNGAGGLPGRPKGGTVAPQPAAAQSAAAAQPTAAFSTINVEVDEPNGAGGRGVPEGGEVSASGDAALARERGLPPLREQQRLHAAAARGLDEDRFSSQVERAKQEAAAEARAQAEAESRNVQRALKWRHQAQQARQARQMERQKYPDTWRMSQPGRPEHGRFELTADSREFQDVAASFKQTMQAGVRIVSIERVQNVRLWQLYDVKLKNIVSREKEQDESRPQSRFERVWLFHGCRPDVVPKIVAQGFNRSFCGQRHRVRQGRLLCTRCPLLSPAAVLGARRARSPAHLRLPCGRG